MTLFEACGSASLAKSFFSFFITGNFSSLMGFRKKLPVIFTYINHTIPFYLKVIDSVKKPSNLSVETFSMFVLYVSLSSVISSSNEAK